MVGEKDVELQMKRRKIVMAGDYFRQFCRMWKEYGSTCWENRERTR